jgi:hypothetical protein
VSGYESGVGERGKEEVGLLNSAPTGISSGYLRCQISVEEQAIGVYLRAANI